MMTVNNWSWETLDPESFYDDLGYSEWERLDRDFYHRLEWNGTIDYLEQYLPERGHIPTLAGLPVGTPSGSLNAVTT